MGEPARGYSREPFQPGNTVARRHGAYSEREIGPLAEEVEASLPTMAPHTSQPCFAPARRRYARAEAIASTLWRWLVEHGPLDEVGAPRPALAALHQWETTAARRGEALALDPASYAKLLAQFASLGTADAEDVLARLVAEGRAIVEARQAALEAPQGDAPVHAADSDVRGAPDGARRPLEGE